MIFDEETFSHPKPIEHIKMLKDDGSMGGMNHGNM